MNKIIGIILVAFGLVGLVWGGLNWTSKEIVLDIGPIQATRDKGRTIPVPP